MFQLLLPAAAIISFAVTSKFSNKMITAGGNKGLALKFGVGGLTGWNVWNSVDEPRQVVKDKETFGSAANFATAVVVANVAGNYLMKKSIEFSDLENAATITSQMKGGATLVAGLTATFLATKYATYIASEKIFNSDETFEEFVNTGKFKAMTTLTGSACIAASCVQLVSNVVGIENNALKAIASAALTSVVVATIANVNFEVRCDNVKCTIVGKVVADHD
jgi:hypothetical protein